MPAADAPVSLFQEAALNGSDLSKNKDSALAVELECKFKPCSGLALKAALGINPGADGSLWYEGGWWWSKAARQTRMRRSKV